MYAVILMSLTAIYAVKGGMFSVVITEFLQFIVLAIASVTIGILAIHGQPRTRSCRPFPHGWTTSLFGWTSVWIGPGSIDAVNTKIAQDGYSLFGIFFMMVLFQGVLKSAAGPAPNYDMQRVLATRSPKEAAKMNWFVNIVLIFPRYMMIAGYHRPRTCILQSAAQGHGAEPRF